jgi:RimJ/RimL family protein N-acetyltransferase
MNNMITECRYNLPVLATERLLLLPWKMEYTNDMLTIQCQLEDKVFTPMPDIKKATITIKEYINHGREEWAIALKNENGFKIIGQIGLMTRTMYYKEFAFYKEIHWYRIAPEYQGKGYCTEAVKKIMHFAYIALGCDALFIYHWNFNKQSKRVIEKSGFKFKSYTPNPKKNIEPDPDKTRSNYILSKEDYLALHKIFDINEEKNKYYSDFKSEIVQYHKPRGALKKIKGSPYSRDNPIRKIDNISYIKQPGKYLCGQSCVAMLAGVSVDEVVNLIGTEPVNRWRDLEKPLDYYGFSYVPKSIYDSNRPLPDLCIIKCGHGHWAIYYKGIYYDPELGILDECPANARIVHILEIYP